MQKILIDYFNKFIDCFRSSTVFNTVRFLFLNFRFNYGPRNLPCTIILSDKNSPKKYFLSAFLIIKNEAPYLNEIIKHYKLLGIEHVFICDNRSSDKPERVLQQYINENYITLIKDNSHKPMPNALYNAMPYLINSKWVTYFDADEFLIEKQIPLRVFLENLEEFPALAVNWLYFGSDGIESHENKLVMETFCKCSKTINPHVKLIFQPECVLKVINAHFFIYKDFKYAVDENRKPVFGTFNKRIPQGFFVLHHYIFGSKQRYLTKATLNSVTTWERGPSYFKRRKAENWIIDSRKFCDVINFDALPYVKKIKQGFFE